MKDKIEISYIDIELAIVEHYGIRSHIIVPNYYINFGTSADHECDLMIIKRSRYAIEIEIKMSRSDLIADFKKKHGHIDPRLQYLYYAMPHEIYEQCENLIPNYAGVFTVAKYRDKAFVKCIKPAPKKECRKLTIEEQLKIARLGVMRFWNLKKKYKS